MPTILDFHIRPQGVVPPPRGAMSQALGETYSLEIFARGNTHPLATATFDYPFSFITEFELNRLDVNPNHPVGRFERLREFGAKLYAKLFTPKVQQIWQQHKDRTNFLILCLRIAPEAAGLEALPWETLFDGEEFLAAGAKTGMSRLPLDIPPQNDFTPLLPPLKMLAFVSSPLDINDDERLQIEREQEILLQAVNTPAGQGRLQVDFEDEAKLPILESSLNAGYHILHFTGHGMLLQDGGALLLEDSKGKRRPTAVAEILQSLQKAEGTLRLAVISGCQTARTKHVAGFQDIARGLTRRRIPAVIAMQFSITDQGGLQFAELLYSKLASGQSLEMALSATRRGLLQSDDPYCLLQADALAPVLFTANGDCLKTDRSIAVTSQSEPQIDFSFHLPLPQLSFGFYGRRREYRLIRDGLHHQNHRAVIVHGIGGIGKTALVSYAATRLRDHFKGVYTFDCSSGTLSPERIVLELHRYFERLGVKALQTLVHQSLLPENLATYLAQVLSQWSLLLIFDNFESQLVNSNSGFWIADENLRAFLITLVKATATCSRFLFTSRYLFDLDAKRLGNIQELPLGDLSRPEALGLMQKLPHLAAAAFEDKLNAFAIFGGHPYALVALDRHCGYRPLNAVLRDASNVYTELREFLAIELNYARLSDRSRELLNRLAAFREPVPLAATEWMMGTKVALSTEFLQMIGRNKLPEEWRKLDDAAILEKLDSLFPEHRQAENLDKPIAELIRWGLLSPLCEDGQLIVFAVHSLVRQFCGEKQSLETWRACLRDAAAFYLNISKLANPDDKSQSPVWLEIEAFELLIEAEGFEEAAAILLDIHDLLNRWGLGRHLEFLYSRVIPKAEGKTQAILCGNLATLLQERGNYEKAVIEHKRVGKIFEELGDRLELAVSFHQTATCHYLQGDYDLALSLYEKAREIFEAFGNRAGVAGSLGQIGTIHYLRGDYETAIVEHEKSRKIFEALGDSASVAKSLHQIGLIYQGSNNYDAALAEYKKSLEISKDLEDLAGMANTLHQLGMIYQKWGDYNKALSKYEESLQIEEKLGNKAGISDSLLQFGILYYIQGDYIAALREYEKSLKIKEEIGDRAGLAVLHGQIGGLFIQTGQYCEAFEHLFFAFVTSRKLQSSNAAIDAKDLNKLRAKWGAENFDAAWQQATGEVVPEWLK